VGVREIYPETPGVWPRQPLLAGPAWPGYIPGVVTTTRPSLEGPGEHLRNALQLLSQLPFVGEPVFDAAVSRLRRALELLELRH